MKGWSELIRNMTMLTQLGLSFITPLLLCLALCFWLDTSKGVGGWVYILGFFFGLGGSFTVAYKFYRSVVSQEKKKERQSKVFFNRHH
ncbi:MAG: AtpZ/AtpI family protein [Eubacteriales bacterium]|nr:AtpZ/AtpI family protein [Eubacteriales bacterium]